MRTDRPTTQQGEEMTSNWKPVAAGAAPMIKTLERGDWINLLLALVATAGVVLAGVLL